MSDAALELFEERLAQMLAAAVLCELAVPEDQREPDNEAAVSWARERLEREGTTQEASM